jgi:TM2 domain-containing membrane protein YozV
MSNTTYQQSGYAGTSQPVVYSEPVTTMIVEGEAWVPQSDMICKDGFIVLILNLIFPGLGHVLLGQRVKGITFFVGIMLCYVLVMVFAILLIGIFFLIPVIFIWIGSMIDGYNLGERVKKGYPIMKGELSAPWIKYTGAGLFVKPSFVTDSDQAPSEWHNRMAQVRV